MAKVGADLIWFNGELMPWQNATVHVMSHALHYGSSVFEGIRAYETHKGTCIFRLEEHVERLFKSAKIYRMNIPYTHDEIVQACKDSVSKNNLKAAYLRPLFFLGDIGMGLRPPTDAIADAMIAAFSWEAYSISKPASATKVRKASVRVRFSVSARVCTSSTASAI